MIRTLSLLLLFSLISCIEQPHEEDVTVPASLMLKSAGREANEIGMVNGVLFEVDNFNTWMLEYEKVSKDLIIAFRNVDNPKMTLVFEGSGSHELAKSRVKLLSSEAFIKRSTALGDPVSSYYKIEYFDKVPDPSPHFIALSYPSGGDPEQDWLGFIEQNKPYFDELKIEGAGIGTNPENPEQAYLLFRQEDFVSFRKSMNSPKKINKFLNKLNLPEHTLISYWVRISQPAD